MYELSVALQCTRLMLAVDIVDLTIDIDDNIFTVSNREQYND